MEPITRKEIYLAKWVGEYNGEIPEPVTSEELYLACLCQGDDGDDLPAPIVRQEHYPAFLIGINSYLPEPITRTEYLWNAICVGGSTKEIRPITNEETYLIRVSEVYKKAAYDTRKYAMDRFTVVETDPFTDDPRNYGYTDLVIFVHKYNTLNRASISITMQFHASSPAGAFGDSLVVLYATEVKGIIPKARIATYQNIGGNAAIGVDTEGNIVVKAQDPSEAVNFSGRKTISFYYTTA